MTSTSQGQSSVDPCRSSPHSLAVPPAGHVWSSRVEHVGDVGGAGPVLEHERAHHLEPRDGALGTSTGGLAPEHVHSLGRGARGPIP